MVPVCAWVLLILKLQMGDFIIFLEKKGYIGYVSNESLNQNFIAIAF